MAIFAAVGSVLATVVGLAGYKRKVIVKKITNQMIHLQTVDDDIVFGSNTVGRRA